MFIRPTNLFLGTSLAPAAAPKAVPTPAALTAPPSLSPIPPIKPQSLSVPPSLALPGSVVPKLAQALPKPSAIAATSAPSATVPRLVFAPTQGELVAGFPSWSGVADAIHRAGKAAKDAGQQVVNVGKTAINVVNRAVVQPLVNKAVKAVDTVVRPLREAVRQAQQHISGAEPPRVQHSSQRATMVAPAPRPDQRDAINAKLTLGGTRYDVRRGPTGVVVTNDAQRFTLPKGATNADIARAVQSRNPANWARLTYTPGGGQVQVLRQAGQPVVVKAPDQSGFVRSFTLPNGATNSQVITKARALQGLQANGMPPPKSVPAQVRDGVLATLLKVPQSFLDSAVDLIWTKPRHVGNLLRDFVIGATGDSFDKERFIKRLETPASPVNVGEALLTPVVGAHAIQASKEGNNVEAATSGGLNVLSWLLARTRGSSGPKAGSSPQPAAGRATVQASQQPVPVYAGAAGGDIRFRSQPSRPNPTMRQQTGGSGSAGGAGRPKANPNRQPSQSAGQGIGAGRFTRPPKVETASEGKPELLALPGSRVETLKVRNPKNPTAPPTQYRIDVYEPVQRPDGSFVSPAPANLLRRYAELMQKRFPDLAHESPESMATSLNQAGQRFYAAGEMTPPLDRYARSPRGQSTERAQAQQAFAAIMPRAMEFLRQYVPSTVENSVLVNVVSPEQPVVKGSGRAVTTFALQHTLKNTSGGSVTGITVSEAAFYRSLKLDRRIKAKISPYLQADHPDVDKAARLEWRTPKRRTTR